LQYQQGDTIDDLFPGTGGMSEAVKLFEESANDKQVIV
jgi:hypothetical protein